MRKTLAVTLGALVVLGACGQGPLPVASSPETTSAAQSAESARAGAVDAYQAMWNGFADAGNTSDAESPVLGRHASGAALDKLRRSLGSDREKGLVSKGKPLLDPKVSAADPAEDPKKITITDCGDSGNWLKYHKEEGRPADNALGGRRLIKAAVDKQPDGTWKVSDYAIHELGSC